MTSVRGLSNLHCSTCNEVTLHSRNLCVRCDTPNHSSGNPPVPRPARPYGYSTMKAVNYDARAEQAAARRRARAARAKALTRSHA